MKNEIQNKLNEIFQLKFSINDELTLDVFKSTKSSVSAKKMAELLSLNEAMFFEFETALKQYFQFRNDASKSRISCFRLSLWLETICKNLGLSFSLKEAISNEETAIKQVRALELIIRDLVNENLGGKENVLIKLQELFKHEVIEKWIKSADDTGVLSGTTFSELSNIFLDKNIFLGLEDIFKEPRILISNSQRDSLRFILEDIRVIRNAIAHNKRISHIQIEALNEYYKLIAEIISESKLTTLDSKIYFDGSIINIKEYFDSLKEDNTAISGELLTIKKGIENITSKLEDGFDDVKSRTSEIQATLKSKWVSKKFMVFYTIILVLLVFGGVVLNNYNSRAVNAKIQLKWLSDRASYDFNTIDRVRVEIGSYTKELYLNKDGLLELSEVSYENLGKPVFLSFYNSRIYQMDTISLERSMLQTVQLNLKGLDKVRFSIKDFSNGMPIKGAIVKFAEITAMSNEFGEALANIPQSQQSIYINIEVFCNGYETYKLNEVLVDSNLPIEILLNKN
jgi:hypothetical protein